MAEIEDEDFLSQVAAAEAEALSNKRRKTTANASDTVHSLARTEEEGAYTAALKGNRGSSQGRVKVVVADNVFGNNQSGSGGGSGGVGGIGDDDSCFKCGKSGHWARDCGAAIGGSDPSVPEKACPCGLGACLVLTANTEKNRGRKFYKCPLREENGGCGFFEWCDNSSGTNNMTGGNQNYASKSKSSTPDVPCPCGAGSCVILTAKTGKNIGQQFYRCPANQGSSCGYFKWCNDHPLAAGLQGPAANASKVSNIYDTSNKSYGMRSGSSCFKCGKEGHWAKDCSMPSSDSTADVGGRSASSGTCYKCGKPGHWAKDCSF
ncbi:hypothetical protein L1049_024133 [Liquidambar formosana]|uniref:Uncharacterized protein n=1 Tax=Liquidambar formosana TaxID=63359 RepID=A0AAP0X123_LIQFO